MTTESITGLGDEKLRETQATHCAPDMMYLDMKCEAAAVELYTSESLNSALAESDMHRRLLADRLDGIAQRAREAGWSVDRAEDVPEILQRELDRVTTLLADSQREYTALFVTARNNQADAERYRWLRESMNLDDPRREAHALACFVSDTAANMDAAVDAAMAPNGKAELDN